MVLKFPVLSDYSVFYYENTAIFATHGHVYGLENIPNLKSGDVFLCGHTHVSGVKELQNGIVYINPGSVSIPKENTKNGYSVFENGVFTLKTLDGNVVSQYSLDNAK
jgi:predicted phosphodiesterase